MAQVAADLLSAPSSENSSTTELAMIKEGIPRNARL
jgi:hypothetical protein